MRGVVGGGVCSGCLNSYSTRSSGQGVRIWDMLVAGGGGDGGRIGGLFGYT